MERSWLGRYLSVPCRAREAQHWGTQHLARPGQPRCLCWADRPLGASQLAYPHRVIILKAMETVVKNNIASLDKSTAKVVIFLASNEMTKSKVRCEGRGSSGRRAWPGPFSPGGEGKGLQAAGNGLRSSLWGEVGSLG